jgi:endoglucanase
VVGRAWRRRPVRFSIISTSVAVLVAATIGVSLGVAQAEEGDVEHIVNGDFAAGAGAWFGYPAAAAVTDGQLCDAVDGGANPWDAGVGVNGLALRPGGTYTLTFDAVATKAVNVNANVQLDADPFTAAVSRTLSVGTEVQTFTVGPFQWLPSPNTAGVALQLGGNGASWTFCVDNVSLIGPPGPSEQIANGGFDNGTTSWWWTENLAASVVNGALCTEVPGPTPDPWSAIVGQDNVALLTGESYTFSFKASASSPVVVRALVQNPDTFATQIDEHPALTSDLTTFEYTFTSQVDLPNGQVAFQIGSGGATAPWTFCLDDVSLLGGAEPPVFLPDTGPRVRVNQVAYVPKGPKNATLVTDAVEPMAWELKNSAGVVVKTGMTVPRGEDASSRENVHSIDFSFYGRPGSGYTLTADGETSHPFDIGADAYKQMRIDALKFYYTQRSGIEILASLRPGYERPAGHVQVAPTEASPNQGDLAVPCFQASCDYTLDVSGGWYDAGDHGKYVVNGGISVFQLMSEYERAGVLRTRSTITRDNVLALPESGNRVPDILDEARWQMEFMLSMQVPNGKPLAGMAHHKIHDENWTGLPLLPHLDPQPRFLHPPSTAATLNLAATGAQCARVFHRFDHRFAHQCLAAARKAWAAAVANPALYAPGGGVGGGPYDDTNVTDEFYWAAAELYITTGERQYKNAVLGSSLHTADVFRDDGFDWGYTATLGRLDLALLPNHLPNRSAVRASVLAGADKYLATLKAHPYGVPYAPTGGLYAWGSNNLVLNNMVVMAVAHDLSGKEKYRAGVLEGMNYLLGRNALNQSYVTGYGEKASQNQHSRWYAAQLNPLLPHPPNGSLSGGPNSSIQDPKAQQLLQGCAPQFCYLDDIDSWSTNELTINWNSPLSWITAWIADEA